MLILSIDSSTSSGSVSLVSKEGIVGEMLLNLKRTHSQRLMPQLITLIESCGYKVKDLDGIGATLGPGSFTGIRIGLTTAKTLAQSLEIPIVGVSNLEAIAYSLRYSSAYLCPMIDARRERVFTALYKGGENLELQREEAIMELDDLLEVLKEIKSKIYFIGEGANLYQEKISSKINEANFVSSTFNNPRPAIVGELARAKLLAGEDDDYLSLTPNYLKASQAEIQWRKKQSN
ncbi:tRNA (adenosine(37)-N6)-threonylcarbamoyltransferase complex dimerization subunit type 1 TsaB [Halonatronum saccharophilum]|uniref:tRNA (adenosine(37)-N6)-threonylcarbamoyltransferase complex dimerization subunit type 1 TsaB n=1 Tax=Halonatronum saccharophilum TaxID=150060 RepID=UPI0004859DDC|nr:tRNA (adenosine(37)-N6)-threonylcarbamoyltransferase complex dimerization subunit type 1 TsaB [Halonatronum saccharophilum]